MAAFSFPKYVELLTNPYIGDWLGFGIYILLGWGAGVGIVKIINRKDPKKGEAWTPIASIIGAAMGLAMAGVFPWANFSRTVIALVAFIFFIPCAFGLFNIGLWTSKMPKGKPNFVFALLFSLIWSAVILFFLVGYLLGYSELWQLKNYIFWPVFAITILGIISVLTALVNVGWSKRSGSKAWGWAEKVVRGPELEAKPEKKETTPEGTPEAPAPEVAPAPGTPTPAPTPAPSGPGAATTMAETAAKAAKVKLGVK